LRLIKRIIVRLLSTITFLAGSAIQIAEDKLILLGQVHSGSWDMIKPLQSHDEIEHTASTTASQIKPIKIAPCDRICTSHVICCE